MSLIKTIHKWLSLLVGLQLLIWLGTGLYFNLMDSVEASGNQYRVRVVEPNVDSSQLIEPKSVLQEFNAAVTLSQITLLAKPYYLLTHDKALYPYFKNQYTLVDAIKGKQVLVDEAMARQLATASYSGAGKILAASKQTPPFDDRLKEKNTLWRVDFDDKINTSVYIDAASGRLAAHSNDDKRFVDIAFMLHFMDYTQEGSFNNVQIIVFAIFTLFFALSGFIWTIELGINGQYSLSHLLPKRFIKNNTKSVQVLGLDDTPLHNISLSGHENLLDGLIHHDIALPSSCGGGGTCGRCRVKLTASVNLNVKITASDNQQFTPEELALGYRLACQHNSDEIESLTLLDDTQADKHQLILASSEFISPFIKELKFKTMSGKPITFKAGAFMRFFIPAASGNTVPTALPHALSQHWDHIDKHEFRHDSCSRNYSLANCVLPIDGLELNGDVHGNELHFTIKLHQAPKMANADLILPGVGSHFICNLLPGDSIDAVGPFSEFCAKPISDKAMVMVGAGSGMAPLKSLIEEQLFKFGTSRPIHFFFGARSEADLIYQDYFTALAVKHDHFFYYPVLSRPTGKLASEVSGHPFVTKGYVQDRLATELAAITSKAAGIRDIEFYLCGPATMMTSTIEQLNAYGVKDSQIAFDSFV
ncbi:2Fe-2S iron-sulfur cluster binding domain-containing protein [Shewanella sp. D64]|uniref:2Fe-2S iron-sulfur cluster-binding protein n=1 Tax=unclassified Shewanella TaxID=196818 RepID=UPI0022BA3FE5|nr:MULTISPECIES: 2Fe-2S iron-sulfur cluster-binding protein [unclassified Shewanella]MEC4724072.1 2Fe-2S iron-sulfur cluster binding domain-containing protein [Shewanella sp. D64]MEC4736092.1 2Fe-2S iron-sulfur cluster binding domain-containing protein [Shewanella sp. E94]WBJ97964.1 2Fe-2S iron-sulfur cluster binding domain-containing protein [Shewanella sp. MTB7]